MTQEKAKVWTREILTKKLILTRKRIRTLESELGSEREARKALEEKVEKISAYQNRLMGGLRQVFKKLGLNPSRSKSKA